MRNHTPLVVKSLFVICFAVCSAALTWNSLPFQTLQGAGSGSSESMTAEELVFAGKNRSSKTFHRGSGRRETVA